jgi:YfiH family protein
MNWFEPDWVLPPHVHAAVTLRSGGISQGGYSSFNIAGHVDDNAEYVHRNRKILKAGLNLPSEPVWLQQVHGVEVIKADRIDTLAQADASYTDESGVVCAVMTADCLPVLFCGDQGRVVAAAHAGWRGLQAGILERTLEMMNCREMQVWLGPAIGPENFQVGDDVRTLFIDKYSATLSAFQIAEPGKWLADIYQLARIILRKQAVDQIFGGGFCTVSDSSRFFSYRRDGAKTGRMASLIWRD